MQKFIKSMTGYKATNKDMICSPDNKSFRFELNKWYEIEGEIEECKNGFHFCEQPSGVWSYYSEKDTRVFKIEAEDVLDTPFEPGTAYKRVCRRIKLVEEVKIGGNCNTGNCNTGYRNTGDCNTGSSNAGYRNTGYYNTGNCNTGNCNTGNCNTGYYNTGDRNTGNYNTGDYNLTNYSSGFFCLEEPEVVCFDVVVQNMSRGTFLSEYGCIMRNLHRCILAGQTPVFEEYSAIPNITPERLTKYCQRYRELSSTK